MSGRGNGAARTLAVEGTPGLPPATRELNTDGSVNGADLDRNGVVDADDLGRLLTAWTT
jgi:hypothetical protein